MWFKCSKFKASLKRLQRVKQAKLLICSNFRITAKNTIIQKIFQFFRQVFKIRQSVVINIKHSRVSKLLCLFLYFCSVMPLKYWKDKPPIVPFMCIPINSILPPLSFSSAFLKVASWPFMFIKLWSSNEDACSWNSRRNVCYYGRLSSQYTRGL